MPLPLSEHTTTSRGRTDRTDVGFVKNSSQSAYSDTNSEGRCSLRHTSHTLNHSRWVRSGRWRGPVEIRGLRAETDFRVIKLKTLFTR